MSTAAQFAANQSNSQSSTGPATEAGKRTSSQNALKHGLACGRTIIEGEDPAVFAKLIADLRNEHRPATPTEVLIVDKMAVSFWFARRATIFIANAFETAPASEPVPEKLAVLLRYQTANDRAFFKALQTLQALQKERRQNPVNDPAARLTPEEIGFVQNATPEELLRDLIDNHNMPVPSPEEREELLKSLR